LLLITVTKLFECGSTLVAARDILDELGRVVLNRNSDNLFAETEQVTTAHVVPGIEAPLRATGG
jgi:catalase